MFGRFGNLSYLCTRFRNRRPSQCAWTVFRKERFRGIAQLVAFLVWDQAVACSSHAAPTYRTKALMCLLRALSSAGSERLPYKQRVGGSNPSAPTKLRD